MQCALRILPTYYRRAQLEQYPHDTGDIATVAAPPAQRALRASSGLGRAVTQPAIFLHSVQVLYLFEHWPAFRNRP